MFSRILFFGRLYLVSVSSQVILGLSNYCRSNWPLRGLEWLMFLALWNYSSCPHFEGTFSFCIYVRSNKKFPDFILFQVSPFISNNTNIAKRYFIMIVDQQSIQQCLRVYSFCLILGWNVDYSEFWPKLNCWLLNLMFVVALSFLNADCILKNHKKFNSVWWVDSHIVSMQA